MRVPLLVAALLFSSCGVFDGAVSLCGNGQLDPGEECDPPTENGRCTDSCQLDGRCGDGVVQPPEQCDDGNAIANDGCSPSCQIDIPCGQPGSVCYDTVSLGGVGTWLGAALGDVDDDGALDLVTVGKPAGWVLFGDGTGRFGAPEAGVFGYDVALVDLDHDGRSDRVTCGDGLAALSTGKGFGAAAPQVSCDALAVGDLDEDGFADVVLGDGSIYLNDGKGALIPGGSVPLPAGTLAVGDVDGDHHLDLVVNGSGAATIFVGDGKGTFTKGSVVSMPDGPIWIVDLDGDGRAELVGGVYPVTIARANGKGEFSPVALPASGLAAIGDFDGDGRTDIAVAADPALAFYLQDAVGAFVPSTTTYVVTGSAWKIVTSDLNHDGRADLLLTDDSGARELLSRD